MDPVIECFKQEFDRFHGFLEKQIEVCPSDAVWNEKTGNFTYWHHIFHAFAIVEIYVLPVGAPSRQTYFPVEVARMQKDPDRSMTREEMHKLAADMKQLAHTYFDGQSTATLNDRNETMTRFTGQESSNLRALIGLVRHYNYHIGCVDSLLRAKGLPGVY